VGASKVHKKEHGAMTFICNKKDNRIKNLVSLKTTGAIKTLMGDRLDL
jgi:hypothetical protein